MADSLENLASRVDDGAISFTEDDWKVIEKGLLSKIVRYDGAEFGFSLSPTSSPSSSSYASSNVSQQSSTTTTPIIEPVGLPADGVTEGPSIENKRMERAKRRKENAKLPQSSDDGRLAPRGSQKTSRRNKTRQNRQILDRIKQNTTKILQDDELTDLSLLAILKSSEQPVRIYESVKDTKSEEFLREYQQIELDLGKKPVPHTHAILQSGIIRLHTPGIHVGIDPKSQETLWVVKISPYESMDSGTMCDNEQIVKWMMDWCDVGYENRSNGPQKTGVMHAYGWRKEFTKGKTIGIYVPDKDKLQDDPERRTKYRYLVQRCRFVHNAMRAKFGSLHPTCFEQVERQAKEMNIPAFSSPEINLARLLKAGRVHTCPPQSLSNESLPRTDFSSTDVFGANSLTITHSDFANLVHMDHDISAYTYGIWWTARKQDESFVLSKTGHEKIKGGGFIWPEFRTMVDFQRAGGMVEIIWRGNTDYHGTVSSESAEGYTRFGSSIQITEATHIRIQALIQRAGKEGIERCQSRIVGQTSLNTRLKGKGVQVMPLEDDMEEGEIP